MDKGITYAPWTAIKSQVLTDFVMEWTEVQMPSAAINQECWMMYFDGSLMKKGVDAGLVFISPFAIRMRYVVRLYFPASNNVPEYETLVNGLCIAIDQVMKDSSCHDPMMATYCQEVRRLEE
jgi:hypothetical protein